MTELNIYEEVKLILQSLDFTDIDTKGILPIWEADNVSIGIPRQNRYNKPLLIFIYPEQSNMENMTFKTDKVNETINLWIVSGYDNRSAFNTDEDILYRASCAANAAIRKLQSNRQLNGKAVNLHFTGIQTFPPMNPEEVTAVLRCGLQIEWMRSWC